MDISQAACGLVKTTVNDRRCVVEYEPDSELRDSKQVPLLAEGGVEGLLCREVLPYAPDAWYYPGERQGRLRDQLPPAFL